MTLAEERVAVVGGGRMGTALLASLPDAAGPFGRGFDGSNGGAGDGDTAFTVVLLAVPDGEITAAAAAIAPGPLVGHCSGATGLGVLAPHECFSMHPLMTVTAEASAARATMFTGASAAVAGSTPRAQQTARELATTLGLRPVEIADADRAAYHAAASIAANFLVTLEDLAETLITSAGGDRAMLVPLVRAAVENWAAVGGRRALTGPIARGDEATVVRQRDAVAERLPDLLPLFDALTEATRSLSRRSG